MSYFWRVRLSPEGDPPGGGNPAGGAGTPPPGDPPPKKDEDPKEKELSGLRAKVSELEGALNENRSNDAGRRLAFKALREKYGVETDDAVLVKIEEERTSKLTAEQKAQEAGVRTGYYKDLATNLATEAALAPFLGRAADPSVVRAVVLTDPRLKVTETPDASGRPRIEVGFLHENKTLSAAEFAEVLFKEKPSLQKAGAAGGGGTPPGGSGNGRPSSEKPLGEVMTVRKKNPLLA